eukprot:6229722-Lingulodinium_polyedra.AAC.1
MYISRLWARQCSSFPPPKLTSRALARSAGAAAHAALRTPPWRDGTWCAQCAPCETTSSGSWGTSTGAFPRTPRCSA